MKFDDEIDPATAGTRGNNWWRHPVHHWNIHQSCRPERLIQSRPRFCRRAMKFPAKFCSTMPPFTV